MPELAKFAPDDNLGDPSVCDCLQRKLNRIVAETSDGRVLMTDRGNKYSKYKDSIMGSGGQIDQNCYISQSSLSTHKNNIFMPDTDDVNKHDRDNELDFLAKLICECSNCDSDTCAEKYPQLCKHIKRYGKYSNSKNIDKKTKQLILTGLFNTLDKDNTGCIERNEFDQLINSKENHLDVLNDINGTVDITLKTESQSDDDSDLIKDTGRDTSD